MITFLFKLKKKRIKIKCYVSTAEAIVERLLFMGAETEVVDRFSSVPLHRAACVSSQLVRILLEKGCSINAQDNAG